MFCVLDGKIMVAEIGTTESHIDRFHREGWLENFAFEEILRGMYWPETNSLYFFKGFDFSFDEALIEQSLYIMPQLLAALGLKDGVKINFGPMDKFIKGKEYRQLCWG
ncbi:hypothetical protein HGA64_03930 [Candidatus Falkowbacteria bacterium]|nr:hypothetical protein [Candidatus Falkowbacteria bacterium]